MNSVIFKKSKYSNYKSPIVSIGIIPFTIIDNKIHYLLIRRKDSVGYIDLLRGKYILFYKNYIQNIIDVMTNEEKNKLLNTEFNILWKEMWGKHSAMQYRNEEKNAEDKFNILKNNVNTNNISFNLEQCIKESETNWVENEWGFPKGRKNYQEKDLTCALREFEEETGISKAELNIISNIQPIEEIFIGSNMKSYKHKYYVAYIKNNKNKLNRFQKSEVSKMEWKSVDEALKSFREYQYEKKDMLKKINNTLETLRLIL
jgi:8-oxo-dGTP pyrophosphatase MutT (NUDIX family)